MGRTNATYRRKIDKFQDTFKPFQKALREENKTYIDELWSKMYRYSSAGSYMNSSRPGLVAVISIMLGLQKEINSNEKEIEEIKERMSQLENVQS